MKEERYFYTPEMTALAFCSNFTLALSLLQDEW